MALKKFKFLICCLLGHKMVQNYIYVGETNWLVQNKCLRCDKIDQEDKLTWLNTEQGRRFAVRSKHPRRPLGNAGNTD